MKAMLFAAGLGTRLKPFTENAPKALAVVNGKTLLERNIIYLRDAGVEDVVINVHHYPEMIRECLTQHNNFDCNILISDETDHLLETGGGLKKAWPLLDGAESVLVMNVDILTDLDLKALIEYHKRSARLATLAVMDRDSTRKLALDFNELLRGWKNFDTNATRGVIEGNGFHFRAFSGIQIINKQIWEGSELDGKFSLIDLYLEQCNKGSIVGFDHTGGTLIDVGKPASLEKAGLLFS